MPRPNIHAINVIICCVAILPPPKKNKNKKKKMFSRERKREKKERKNFRFFSRHAGALMIIKIICTHKTYTVSQKNKNKQVI
jgi:nitrite reductase/ring-hydroxylating ferredoxin subunit